MADNSVRALFCLLEGESAFFQVKTNTEELVTDLKEHIHLKKCSALEDVDSNHLSLRKVNDYVPIASPALRSRVDEKGDVTSFTEELSDSASVGDVFPEHPERMSLHLIVGIHSDAPPFKRRRLDNKPDPNLVQLHKLFWGVAESPLYHTLNIKVPHPMTLEVDEEAGGSDFTIIRLPEGVRFPFEGSTILVPEIYTTFWGLVAKDDADWQTRQESPEPHTFSTHSTIITGQPGIGKTVLKDYILVRRLQERMVTIFCDDPSFAHVFDGNGVRRVDLTMVSRIEELDGDSKCCALVNISPDLPQPPRHFYPKYRRGRVVVATSPNSEHLNTFSKERKASVYCMPTCDWDDLYCSSLLYVGLPDNVSNQHCESLREGYAKFGGIKRRCFYYLQSKDDVDAELRRISGAVDGISSMENFILSATGPMPFDNKTTNLLVKIEPVDGSGWRDTRTTLLGGHIAGRVLDRIRLYRTIKVSESITQALEKPDARGHARTLFEQAVHRKFRAGIRFQPRGMTANAPNLEIDILKTDNEADGYFYNLSVRAAKGSRQVNDKYLSRYMVPISKTKESVNSVWISKGVTVFFQMSVSPRHPMKLHGILEILAQLPAEAQKDVRLVFVLPANDEPTKDFKSQKIERPAGLPNSKVATAEKVDCYPQYVHYVDLGQFN